jgi:DNA-binding SARP family transcriptional activator/tetratricopeptide (TPR) repeat protein
MAAELEFGLLGPLLVRRDSVTVPALPGKLRVLLATLLLNANRLVPLDELSAALWGHEPPPSARVTLRNYIKELRKALAAPGSTRICTLPGGYQIRTTAGELDLSNFEALRVSAKQAAGRGDWDRAEALLGSAVALWRGAPLADVQSEWLALREVPRLEEMRLQAAEERIDLELQLGRHAHVIADLRQMTAHHPLRERLQALLMLALYRDGQQAAALAAYQRARYVLVTELGVDPGPELLRLQQQILAVDPELAAPVAPPRLAAGGSPCNAAPPVRVAKLGAVPRQLPPAVPYLAGRASELEALDALRDSYVRRAPAASVLVISGTAGVGKTSLAVYWAHQTGSRFPDGQLYVNLRGFDPSGDPVRPAEAMRSFLHALGVAPAQIPDTVQAQAGLYRSQLASRSMLILLDNARDAEQVRPLLPGNPACLVVVTSRSQLTGLIATDGARLLTLPALTVPEARELLASKLGAERVTAQQCAADELIRLSAQLPLALVIVAARVTTSPGLTLEDLAAGLRESPRKLDELDTGEAPTSLRAVFSWSYQELSGPAARMFRLLGVHPGPDISAAAAASLAGISAGQSRALLRELGRSHLITEQRPGRFASHDMLRAYAAERAQTDDSEQDRYLAIQRMLDHYLHSARGADRVLYPEREVMGLTPPERGVTPETMADYEQAMAWFEAEHAVLLAVITQAVAVGFDRYGWQLPAALTTFLNRRGLWHDDAAIQRIALAAARRIGDRAGQALSYSNLGHASALLGWYQDARAHYEQALEQYSQLDDSIGQARAYTGKALICERQGRYGESLIHCLKALHLSQVAGDRARQASTLNNVGWCHAQMGDLHQAVSCCQQALTLYHDLDDRHGEATTWDSLGFAHHHLRDYQYAVTCYERSLHLYRELGDLFNQAEILTHIGDAYHAADDMNRASSAWRDALEIFDDLHHSDAESVRKKLLQVGGANSAEAGGEEAEGKSRMHGAGAQPPG